MKNNDQNGQALIELIIFLPLMVTLYSVVGGFASSINGSINQQKIVRSYFYYRIQNNSTIPGPKSGDWDTWRQFGMFFIGWKDYFKDESTPVMPCYNVKVPFKNDVKDLCEDAYKDTKTLWVRVGTVYGVCGGTYVNQNNIVTPAPDGEIGYASLIDKGSCVITE